MNIKKIFIIGAGWMTIAGAMMAAALIYSTTQLKLTAVGMEAATESLRISEEIEINFLQFNRAHRLYRQSNSQLWELRYKELQSNLDNLLEKIQTYITSPQEQELVNNTRRAIYAHIAALEKNEQANINLEESFGLAITIVEEMIRHESRQVEDFRLQLLTSNKFANVFGMIVLVFFAFAFLGAVVIYNRVILQPLSKLRKTMLGFQLGKSNISVSKEDPEEIRDITRTFAEMAKKLEGQREQQLRFLSAVAYDLRIPLQTLQSSAELLCFDSANTANRDELNGIIQKQTTLLSNMVDDLLDTTRIEAGQLKLKMDKVEINQIVKNVVNLYEGISRNHPLKLELPTEPIVAEIDPLRIEQVLNNLVSNAIKYSPYGGEVKIVVKDMMEKVSICVYDQGVGIEQDEREHIFEPFKRTSTTREAIPGVGLGLSATKRIIEAHGGEINVKSQAGAGACFCILLPGVIPMRKAG